MGCRSNLVGLCRTGGEALVFHPWSSMTLVKPSVFKIFAGSPDYEESEFTVVKYLMPEDDHYALTQVDHYLLPIVVGVGADIATGSRLLWMAVDGKVRVWHMCRMQCRTSIISGRD